MNRRGDFDAALSAIVDDCGGYILGTGRGRNSTCSPGPSPLVPARRVSCLTPGKYPHLTPVRRGTSLNINRCH